jgi:hypothetical protein
MHSQSKARPDLMHSRTKSRQSTNKLKRPETRSPKPQSPNPEARKHIRRGVGQPCVEEFLEAIGSCSVTRNGVRVPASGVCVFASVCPACLGLSLF